MIMVVMQRFPTKKWKVQQIRTILEFNGITETSARIRDRLLFLSNVHLVDRIRGNRVDLYGTCSMSTASHDLSSAFIEYEIRKTGPDDVFPSGEKRSSSVFRK